MHYHWNWLILFEASPDGAGSYLDTLLNGLQWTLITALSAWCIALLLGIFIGVLRTLPSRACQLIANSYIEIFRNIPLLVQMFLWYFVLPELLPTTMGNWLKALPNASFITAVISLGCFTASRIAVQIASGIQALPRGQKMAALALGMNLKACYRYVLLPIALRILIPPLTSEALNIIKNSAVALTIGLLELTARARSMQEFSFQVFEAFTIATLLYVAANLCIVLIMRLLERRFSLPGFNQKSEVHL